jgi:hypothetical protein
MTNNQYQTTRAEPDASSMIETFRAIGYSIETAIADIIDNSISAQAKNIKVKYDWKGENTIIQIADDGCGMNNDELIQAMRPGSKHPNEERNQKDLGRFGLGLKTASFSQTRKFSVVSKKDNFNCVYWAWDLDHVNDKQAWELIKYSPLSDVSTDYDNINSGTTVIWYCLDRNLKNVKEEDTEALAKFMELMEGVKKHLEMVFHRYLEQGRIKIWFQEREIKAWDPFLRGADGLQPGAEEYLGDGDIIVKGYVLPHKSKISDTEFKYASGPKGWNEQQGFYIYRNERLLVAGNWLGMFRKEEHYKLCRIMIDIPNTVTNDDNWQIDIKKSVARPPIKVHNQLKAYAREIINKAVNVYRHKGKVLQRKYPSFKFTPVWLEKQRHNKRFYSINRQHPIIKDILEEPSKQSINELLRFIEETIPVPLITIQESEEPESHGVPFENLEHEILISKMEKHFKRFIDSGKTKDEAIAILLSIEPFDKYPQYVEQLTETI